VSHPVFTPCAGESMYTMDVVDVVVVVTAAAADDDDKDELQKRTNCVYMCFIAEMFFTSKCTKIWLAVGLRPDPLEELRPTSLRREKNKEGGEMREREKEGVERQQRKMEFKLVKSCVRH